MLLSGAKNGRRDLLSLPPASETVRASSGLARVVHASDSQSRLCAGISCYLGMSVPHIGNSSVSVSPRSWESVVARQRGTDRPESRGTRKGPASATSVPVRRPDVEAAGSDRGHAASDGDEEQAIETGTPPGSIRWPASRNHVAITLHRRQRSSETFRQRTRPRPNTSVPHHSRFRPSSRRLRRSPPPHVSPTPRHGTHVPHHTLPGFATPAPPAVQRAQRPGSQFLPGSQASRPYRGAAPRAFRVTRRPIAKNVL